jgi:glycosidase
MSHPFLYEINTRCWLAELSKQAGRRLTLAGVPDSEFDFWQRCGFTHIWLMGVWSLGKRGRAHSERALAGREEEFGACELAGSPYAITGYTVSRKLGGETALAKFRRKLNERGMKLVLDFIPNHTALDHPWIEAHPEFYLTSDSPREHATKPDRGMTKWFAHGWCGFGDAWIDTLQLNYSNPALRRAMIDELLSVSTKCDGVRCDMAMLVLNEVFAKTWKRFASLPTDPRAEFWSEAIAAVRLPRGDFVFLAEVYWDLEAPLQELGFDFTYDKRLYDRMVARDPAGIVNYLHSLPREFMDRSAHFIENHDEQRIASILSHEEHRAAALLVTALPGMRFIHEGQTSGHRFHANVHFATRRDEAHEENISAFYEWLFGALMRSSVGRGEWKLLRAQSAWTENSTHDNIALIQWTTSARAFDLAVINLGAVQSQCYAPLDVKHIAESNWHLTDLLSDEVHQRGGEALSARGLYLDLRPHAAQLFHFEPTR